MDINGFETLASHPKAMAAIAIFLTMHTLTKAFVDALNTSRAEWDKTPATDDNVVEKALTLVGRILQVTTKAATYLAGFRAKAK